MLGIHNLNAPESISVVLEKLLFLPQGGTAVGSGINAHKKFSKEFSKAFKANWL